LLLLTCYHYTSGNNYRANPSCEKKSDVDLTSI